MSMIRYCRIFLLLITCVAGSLAASAGITGSRVIQENRAVHHEFSQTQTDSLYRQALHFIELQNLDAALLIMEQLVQKETDRLEYWELVLAIHQERGDAAAAAGVMGELIRLQPEERQHYLDQAFLLAYQEEYEKALDVYDRLSERLGKDEQVYTAKARVYQMMGRSEDAIRETEALLQTGEGQLIAFVMLGDLYREGGEFSRAIGILDQGKQRFGDQPLLRISRAEVLRATGQIDEAFEHLSKAFDSHMFDLDYKAGVLYGATSSEPAYEERQLLSLADQLIRQYPVSVKSHAVRADLYAQYGKFEEARASYLAAIEIDPHIPVVWQQLLALTNYLGDTEQAKQYAEQAAGHFPDDPDLLFFAGHAHLVDGDHEQARQYMEAALNNTVNKESSFLAQIYGSLGGIYHNLEMYAASDVAYEEALTLDSLDVYSLNNYAYYLALRNDKLDRALEMSALAVELQPGYATFEDTHAWVLFRRGDHAEALHWIQRAVRNSDEPSATLLEHYGDILFKNGKIRDAVSQWRRAQRYATANDGSLDRLAEKVRARSIVE